MVPGESQAFLLFLYGCRMYRAQIHMKIDFVRIAVNVVPDSQRCQKMNPHLTAIYISSYRFSAHVRKALSCSRLDVRTNAAPPSVLLFEKPRLRA